MASPPEKAVRSELEEIPTEYGDLVVSKWGLDWADIVQIREKLALTPAERLDAAQETLNAAIRIRVKNGHRG